MITLPEGTLGPAIRERSEHACRVGALRSIPTRRYTVTQDGIEFVVRQADLTRKVKAREVLESAGTNPFLPFEPDLFVADLSDTHLCLLNKFNVVDSHLLVVTRAFETQESLLSLADFEALWACLSEFDGLAFYNAGPQAGSSQPHKHLQLVPVPLAEGGLSRTPMDPVLNAALDAAQGEAASLPFVHALAPVDESATHSPARAALASLDLYRRLLRVVDREDGGPYNLLLTRGWMLLVPRSQESYRSIPVNALGFAGSLLVRSDHQLAWVRRQGPLELLRRVAVPRPAAL